MDIALSPDWPALWCYFIILAIGFVVATVQINHLFPGFPQAWTMISNWLLFAVFLLLPVVLFWFLDRTNTLHDTSLFGAILVALAYRQIFAGNVEKVSVPGHRRPRFGIASLSGPTRRCSRPRNALSGMQRASTKRSSAF